MNRPRYIWLAFALCLAVVLAAMGWISLTAVRLDRAEIAARRQAALEENVRLALWRMDSALAPPLAQESARPYFVYSTFLPVDRAYGRMFNRRKGGEVLVPSPLLRDIAPHVLVHFQFEPDGRLTSPRVPSAGNNDLAVPRHITAKAVAGARAQLAKIAKLTGRDQLIRVLPESASNTVKVVRSPMGLADARQLVERGRRPDRQSRSRQSRDRGAVEFDVRNRAVAQNTNAMLQQQMVSNVTELPLPSTDTGGVLMTPLWIDGSLVLARRVTVGGREYVQGCQFDWPAVKSWLLEEIEDLLPGAELEPVTAASPEREARMLAALPLQLIPSGPVEGPDGSLSPVQWSLLVAWACVLVAAVAVAALLLGVIRLSERRAAFVSAVTHELRTPLTTFHIYAEMLSEGMVPDEQQQQYLNTLRAEADRLSHLVENVLCYARLERRRADGRLEDVRLGQLVEQSRTRLADRAAQAGMELLVEGDQDALSAVVRANPSAVDQILFNLVDNACKYASSAADKRIHLAAERSGIAVHLEVSDHGPGVSAAARRCLFRSFAKSARDAADSAPGVGLGLALSRRLARDMGGDLRLKQHTNNGASFVLSLALSK